MPDELTQLLDAWGRTQASTHKPGLLPPSPTAGYLTAVRHARYRRIAVRIAIATAVAGALVFLVYAFRPSQKPVSPSAPPNSSVRSLER